MNAAKLIFTFLLMVSASAQANQWSAFGGINSSEFDGPGNWDREFAFEFGVSYVHPFQDQIYIRTGAGIVQKSSDVGAAGGLDFMLLEIPATAFYKINEAFNVFGGLNFDIMLDDDNTDGKSIVINLPLGMRVDFENNHSMEAYLEFGVTDLAEGTTGDLKLDNSFGVRYLYTFQQ